jgi:hypothetical protein
MARDLVDLGDGRPALEGRELIHGRRDGRALLR